MSSEAFTPETSSEYTRVQVQETSDENAASLKQQKNRIPWKNARIRRVITVTLSLGLALGAGWWAGRTTLKESVQEQPSSLTHVTTTVVQASVGRSLSLNTIVSQPMKALASNVMQGVVTSTNTDAPLAQGDKAYSVNNVPVRVASGSFPFYRDLHEGLQGEDVTQLQRMLKAQGLQVNTDGLFGPSTLAAVKKWQKDNREEVTGVVTFGTLVAIPHLPATLSLGKEIKTGAVLQGGEESIFSHVGEPEFFMAVSSTQLSLIPPEAKIAITYEDLKWNAIISGQKTSDTGEILLVLTSPEGSVVCGQDCSRLPAIEKITLQSQVQIIPEASGPAVPVVAVRSNAQGETYVLRTNGEEAKVNVRGSGDGIAVVDGVEVGEKVVLLDAQVSTPSQKTENPKEPNKPKDSNTPTPKAAAPLERNKKESSALLAWDSGQAGIFQAKGALE